MTTTPKKLLILLATLLAGIALTVSCSKQEPSPQPKTGKKAAKAIPPAPVKLNDISSAGKGTLTATRAGQTVTLNWQIDGTKSTIKNIQIMRSAAGGFKKGLKVAQLDADATTYKDTLPDENAQWYWLKIPAEDDKLYQVGPVRVEEDKAGSANYIKLGDNFKVSVTRTDEFATLTWDFSGDEGKEVKIVRARHVISMPFRQNAKSVPVVTTAEMKSKFTDALKEPNFEYWYWFRATLKSGAVIDKGPIKAEYARPARGKQTKQ